MAASTPSSSSKLPLPLSEDHVKFIELYTGNTTLSSIERCWYFFNNPDNRLILVTEVARDALRGAKYGGVVGSAIGIGLGGLSLLRPDVALLSKLTSVAIGALGGGVSGAGIGAAIFGSKSAIDHISIKVHTEEYIAWRNDAIREGVLGIISKIISDDEIEETLDLCPITHELIVEPVTTGNGKTYEKAAILSWLHTVSPRVLENAARTVTEAEKDSILRETSPLRDEFITPEKLHYDIAYFPRILKKIRALLREKASDAEAAIPEVAAVGLRKYAEMIYPSSIELRECLLDAYNMMRKSGKIDFDTYYLRIREVNDLYGTA